MDSDALSSSSSDGEHADLSMADQVTLLKHHSKISRHDLQAIIGLEVNDMLPYYTAFVHRSMFKRFGLSQERLELLGDAVLGLIVAENLYDTHKDCNEGFLTKARTKLVNGKTLNEVAHKIGIDKFIIMSHNASRIRLANPSSFKHIAEDTLEALIGALYLDKGLMACKVFLKNHILTHVPADILHCDDNFKDILIKLCVKFSKDKPLYTITENSSNSLRFHAQVCASAHPNTILGQGSGACKKDAEKMAAKQAVDMLTEIYGCEN